MKRPCIGFVTLLPKQWFDVYLTVLWIILCFNLAGKPIGCEMAGSNFVTMYSAIGACCHTPQW